jgi:hypothetical protein
MSSWAVLLALNGFQYSGVERALTLAPKTRDAAFRGFWTIPSGWGSFSQNTSAREIRIEIESHEGALVLVRLELPGNRKNGKKNIFATLAGKTIAASLGHDHGKGYGILFDREVHIAHGQKLAVELTA